MRVAVIGGGISGLAAAHRLRGLLGPAATITVVERAERLGGVLRTIDLGGVPFDVGAEAFLARPPEVPALLAELDLRDALVHPTAAAPTLRVGGRTRPLPAGTLLGVPTSRARLNGVLSPAGLAAVVAEPDRSLRWVRGGDTALGGLLRERFGDEVADRIADPLLGGVYAGRVDGLGVRATIPALAAALDAGAPSVIAAADSASRGISECESVNSRDRVAPAPMFGALRGGYRMLLDALTSASGARIRLNTTARGLERSASGWRIVLGPSIEPETLEADAVVLAVPAPALRRLLDDVVPAAAAVTGEIELASSVVVAMAYRATDTCTLPLASGVLIAADEPLSIKAATYASAKWGHLAPEATDGMVRLRASLGRFGETTTLQVDDAELVARVRADLATLTGVTAEPVAVHVQRWGGGLPQYAVGHGERVAAIEAAVAAVPGLAVAGSALHGVGVPACVRTAQAAAERVAAWLSEPAR
ncbi:protoporphyrinogen oxidase [Pseudonocardia asaccharolytica]|uniref:Coproporphyrinogen III oxidase n=1 Tax=Pseudonocardia asaccharolytica DSM 44247 = NBRC 16224 TaxID=1123024 RepID=A0A511CYH5_9PSEU|nr:protoporphyrinogen oxidase [Pseudonocardia asaccharolytica]GEL17601.1 protoporphyrinogen oxidase [Pseudonocardia asaccharolytica DSM 44247 = NBRC 16224]